MYFNIFFIGIFFSFFSFVIVLILGVKLVVSYIVVLLFFIIEENLVVYIF